MQESKVNGVRYSLVRKKIWGMLTRVYWPGKAKFKDFERTLKFKVLELCFSRPVHTYFKALIFCFRIPGLCILYCFRIL
jgi:hypothetical protein